MDREDGRTTTCWRTKISKGFVVYIGKVVGRGVQVDIRALECCITTDWCRERMYISNATQDQFVPALFSCD